MNMFARFDENPAMTLQDIKETKRYGRTDGRTDAHRDGQRENSIPTTNKVCGGGGGGSSAPGCSLPESGPENRKKILPHHVYLINPFVCLYKKVNTSTHS